MRTTVDVHNYLLERDAAHEVVQIRGRFRSPDRVAAVLGLRAEEVGRVDLYEDRDRLVAALVRADRPVNLRRLARAARARELRAVPEGRAAEITGYLPEAMPPAGLPPSTTIVMDRRLARQPVLYFPGGAATAVLKIRGRDLAKALGARLARIAA